MAFKAASQAQVGEFYEAALYVLPLPAPLLVCLPYTFVAICRMST